MKLRNKQWCWLWFIGCLWHITAMIEMIGGESLANNKAVIEEEE